MPRSEMIRAVQRNSTPGVLVEDLQAKVNQRSTLVHDARGDIHVDERTADSWANRLEEPTPEFHSGTYVTPLQRLDEE